jgi:hypothetical protein
MLGQVLAAQQRSQQQHLEQQQGLEAPVPFGSLGPEAIAMLGQVLAAQPQQQQQQALPQQVLPQQALPQQALPQQALPMTLPLPRHPNLQAPSHAGAAAPLFAPRAPPPARPAPVPAPAPGRAPAPAPAPAAPTTNKVQLDALVAMGNAIISFLTPGAPTQLPWAQLQPLDHLAAAAAAALFLEHLLPCGELGGAGACRPHGYESGLTVHTDLQAAHNSGTSGGSGSVLLAPHEPPHAPLGALQGAALLLPLPLQLQQLQQQ